MSHNFKGAIVGREELPDAMMRMTANMLEDCDFREIISRPIPSRGGIVGRWSGSHGSLLAEAIVVRDEDVDDTLSWLNSFFSSFVPITQWCRVLSITEAKRIDRREASSATHSSLGAWIGAILAECSTQAGGVQNLRELSGFAALSSASYAAARSAVIWGSRSNFAEVADRHDHLSSLLRDGSRPLSAKSLSPIWYLLGGHEEGAPSSQFESLKPLRGVFSALVNRPASSEISEIVSDVAEQAGKFFQTPELRSCAIGGQSDRVRALDKLSERLSVQTFSAFNDGLVGLGASFVEPGASISSELLRRHSGKFPSAAIWQGAFAGAIDPHRPLIDQGGLGRFIAKALLAPHDLHARPSCDISYDEVVRWANPGKPLKLDIRGMYARVISVEIAIGVSSTFALGRVDSQASAVRNDSARSNSGEKGGRSLSELDQVTAMLQRRVQKLEENIDNYQSSLDLGLKDMRSRKGRASVSRKE